MRNFVNLFLFLGTLGVFSDDIRDEFNIINIDVNGFINGNDDVRQNIISNVDNALRNDGMFGIINHGISDSLSERLFEYGRNFFDRDIEHKMEYNEGKFGKPGYQPINNEFTSEIKYSGVNVTVVNEDKGKISLVESYHLFGMYNDDSFVNNKIPDEFRDDIQEYWKRTKELNDILLQLMVHAMKCDDGVYDMLHQNMTDNGIINVKLANYPRLTSNNITYTRSGRHKDIDIFTLIQIDNKLSTEGLEIYSKDLNKWLTITSNKEANIIVIVGEYVEIYTNGKYLAPIHRVISYNNDENIDNRRMTINTFSSVGAETFLDVLSCQINADNKEKLYKPIKVIDLLGKIMQGSNADSNALGDTFLDKSEL